MVFQGKFMWYIKNNNININNRIKYRDVFIQIIFGVQGMDLLDSKLNCMWESLGSV